VPAGPAFIPIDAAKAESAGRESMDASLGKASESEGLKPPSLGHVLDLELETAEERGQEIVEGRADDKEDEADHAHPEGAEKLGTLSCLRLGFSFSSTSALL
jgi:hypothetical protein